MNNSITPSRPFKLRHGLALVALALAANPAHAANYVFSDLGTVSGPYAGTNAVASWVNNNGQVAGYLSSGTNTVPVVWNGNSATQLDLGPGGVAGVAYTNNDVGQSAGYNDLGPGLDTFNPIRWDGTSATQLDTLGFGFATVANSINNHGQLVGASWAGSSFHAVRWDGTAITDLGTLGGDTGFALALNDAGQAVGFTTTTGENANHATLWSGGTITDLGTLGGTNSGALNINEAGQIVGNSLLADDTTTHAAFWSSAEATPVDLGSLGSDSAAMDINSSGLIVGRSTFVDGSKSPVEHAMLWDGTSSPGVDLNAFLPAELAAAGWVLAFGIGINNDGVIVGNLSNSLNPNLTAAFMLTPNTSPVPVPGAVWLFGSALAGLIGLRRKV
jgi:probable HAF family extracellular repeat protein